MRPVGNEDLPQPETVEVLRRELADFSGAEEQGLQAAEIAEDFSRELHCGVGNGDRVLANAGVSADAFRNSHRSFEEALEKTVERSASLRNQEGRSYLSADLRLTDDHRVEPRSDPKEMLDHVFIAQHVEMLLERGAMRAAALAEPLHNRVDDVFVRCGDDRLYAIARREQRRAINAA